MKPFRDYLISSKLNLITLVIAFIALMLALGAYAVFDTISIRNSLVRNTEALADLVGANTTAAILFNDEKTASEILSTFRDLPRIRHAVLYLADKRPFSHFLTKGEKYIAAGFRESGHEFTNERLFIYRPINHDGKRIGTICIGSDLDEIAAMYRDTLVVFAFSLIVFSLVAYLLSKRMHRLVVTPIHRLAEVSHRVSIEKDYSIRAEKMGNDEVGQLVDRFNEMLARIAQHDAELAAEINQRRDAEEQMRLFAHRLEISNRELQDFASIASHDLQEPLRKVQAFGERLTKNVNGALDDKSRDYLDRMLSATQRMHVLINDLLTYSRVTTKAQPFAAVNLNEVVGEVISDLEVKIESVHGTVSVQPLPALDADRLQMRQLFQNLIGNALKYHRDGVPPVVQLTASEWNEPSDRQTTRYARITVQDNGIGFDQKYSEQIFVIFQRLHGRSQYEGTGIGLAVCKKIVDRHSGSIHAESVEGQGSRFTIDLPIVQAHA